MVKILAVLILGGVFSSFLEGNPEGLTVRVSESESGSPIPSATVSLLANGRLIAEVGTDENGLAKFVGLDPSPYLVRVSSGGYRDLLDPVGNGRMCVFRSRSQLQYSVALTRTAAVSGSVYRGDGHAATGVQVVALARRTTISGVRLAPDVAVPPVQTDERGGYRLYNLLPGTYSVAAIPSSNASGIEDIPSPSFFPGTTDPSKAQFFDLRPGEERGETVFGLADVQTHELSGEVLGIPISWKGERALVTLFSGGDFRTPVASSMSDAKGHFRFPSVPPGDYQITAFGPESSLNEPAPTRADERSASETVSLGAADRTAELTLQDLPELEGEIVFKDAASKTLCGAIDRILFHPEDGWLDVLTPLRFSRAIKLRNSHFRLKAIPAGRYSLELPGLTEPCHLERTMIGDQETQLESSAPLLNGSAPIKLLVSGAGGSLSCVITGADRHPGGVVVLVSDHGAYPPQSVPVDATFHFQFANLPPGRYFLLARRMLVSESDLDSATIDRTRSTPVNIEAGRKIIVDLKMGI